MSKINNKSAYPIDNQLSLDDFLIGSDADNLDTTRNYLLRGIFSTFKTSLNLASIEYVFAGGSNPDLDESDRGYFTTNSDNSLAAAISTIRINKSDLNSIDITSLITTISGNLSSFMLTLSKPSATGQIFYFQISAIVDSGDFYTMTVDNFVGGNSLGDESTYTLSFDLAGVPSTLTETDPIFTASDVFAVSTTDITNWNAAYSWGDHASGGYQSTLGGTGIVKSTAGAISYLTDNSANWNEAYEWGDHASGGYLTSETDPVFTSSAAAGVTYLRLTQWDTAFGWGDHAAVGYLTSYTETDPVFVASAAFGITSIKLNEWNAAYSWGDHSAVGYITALSDTGVTAGSYTNSDITVDSKGRVTAASTGSTGSGVTQTNGNTVVAISQTGTLYSAISSAGTVIWTKTGRLVSFSLNISTTLQNYAANSIFGSTITVTGMPYSPEFNTAISGYFSHLNNNSVMTETSGIIITNGTLSIRSILSTKPSVTTSAVGTTYITGQYRTS